MLDSGQLDSRQIVRLLADDARRRVVAALILAGEAMSAGAVAERTGQSLRDVVDAMTRLASAGLVADDGVGAYSLADRVFEHAARAEAPAAPASQHADEPDDIARILDVAFRDGKLVQWPSKRSKRLVVLDRLAQQFDIGTRYSEPEVNDLLRPFDDDVATMRRYLVDEQFLDRDNVHYWRCGGTV